MFNIVAMHSSAGVRETGGALNKMCIRDSGGPIMELLYLTRLPFSIPNLKVRYTFKILIFPGKAIELSNCQKEKMIEAYEKIISNIQEEDLAVTRCTLRKIRQIMEEIK